MHLFEKSVDVSVTEYGHSLQVNLFVNGVIISKINCVLEENNSLLIGDIEPYEKRKYYNKGYGSRMMEKLLEFAFEKDIYTIHGNLSITDIGHKERLHHFYEKFGFEIIVYENPDNVYYGKIVKNL